jgi:predicted small secreted protein
MAKREDRTVIHHHHQLTYLMKTSIKHPILLLFALALLTLVSTGCNTAHGFGKDMEKAGDKIQEGTD